MGNIMEVLQWLIPTNAITLFGTWLFNRHLHNARSAKEQQEIFKTMYENLYETVLTIQDDNKTLNSNQVRLERIISKAILCKFYDNHCPVRVELQSIKGKYTTKPIRQPANQKSTNNYPRSGTAEQGNDDSDSGESSETSGR